MLSNLLSEICCQPCITACRSLSVFATIPTTDSSCFLAFRLFDGPERRAVSGPVGTSLIRGYRSFVGFGRPRSIAPPRQRDPERRAFLPTPGGGANLEAE
ncbi:hypothetical protein NL676_038644 [Syzygium grande]|nr:hypothetical protein NL676_038644 [Syzygium grande]